MLAFDNNVDRPSRNGDNKGRCLRQWFNECVCVCGDEITDILANMGSKTRQYTEAWNDEEGGGALLQKRSFGRNKLFRTNKHKKNGISISSPPASSVFLLFFFGALCSHKMWYYFVGPARPPLLILLISVSARFFLQQIGICNFIHFILRCRALIIRVDCWYA